MKPMTIPVGNNHRIILTEYGYRVQTLRLLSIWEGSLGLVTLGVMPYVWTRCEPTPEILKAALKQIQSLPRRSKKMVARRGIDRVVADLLPNAHWSTRLQVRSALGVL